MIKNLQKYFKTAAEAATQEEALKMTTQEKQPAAAGIKTADMEALLATANSNFSVLQSQFSEMKAALEQATTQLSSLEGEKEAILLKAKEAVKASRKEKMEALLGTIPAAPVLAALEGSDDSAFDAMLQAFGAQSKQESQSALFTEQGAAAEVVLVAEDPVKRLAAKMAAQFKQ